MAKSENKAAEHLLDDLNHLLENVKEMETH